MMKRFIKSWQAKVVAIILVLVAGIAGASYVVEGRDSWIAKAAGYVLTPIQTWSSAVTDRVADFFGNLARASETASENEQLREENASLREQLSDYYELQRENTLYRYYLGLAEENPDFAFCPAAVISRTASDVYQGFVVNKGSLDGVELYDPVITNEGLVGYVSEVSSSFSRVCTLLNPDFRAGCQVSRTTASGILGGDASLALEGLCELRYLERSSLIAVGDQIETTGVTGIFPKGLIVGVVQEIVQNPQGVSLTAIIRPTVQLDQVEDVFILTDFEGQGANLEEFLNGEVADEAENAGSDDDARDDSDDAESLEEEAVE